MERRKCAGACCPSGNTVGEKVCLEADGGEANAVYKHGSLFSRSLSKFSKLEVDVSDPSFVGAHHGAMEVRERLWGVTTE